MRKFIVFRRCLVASVLLAFVACSEEQSPPTATSTAPAAAPSAAPSAVPAAPGEAGREVVSESLAYGEVDDNLVHGHFAIPADMVEPLPGVIVVHDWWGLNGGMRAICDRLASQGYIVLGVDLFAGGTAAVAAEARQLEIAVIENPDLALDNLEQAAGFLRDVAQAPNVAIVGYGFGGSWSLNAAVDRGERLSAAALFYGQVSDDQEWLGGLQMPVLGFFAGNDRAVTAKSVEAFKDALVALDKPHDVQLLAGVRRGFADPATDNYDAELAAETWAQLLDFLAANLRTASAN